jgi:hypothetical protein
LEEVGDASLLFIPLKSPKEELHKNKIYGIGPARVVIGVTKSINSIEVDMGYGACAEEKKGRVEKW